jgi:Ca-activated chloride channel family protein
MIADLSGAEFYRATNRRELRNIYDEIDRLEKSEVKLKRQVTYQPLYQWPLLTAMGLLVVELVLANTRYRRIP